MLSFNTNLLLLNYKTPKATIATCTIVVHVLYLTRTRVRTTQLYAHMEFVTYFVRLLDSCRIRSTRVSHVFFFITVCELPVLVNDTSALTSLYAELYW